MALLQGIKKLFGPLLDDLDCVSAFKEAMELQACLRDTSVEENTEDDCFGTTTRHLQPELMHLLC